MSSTAPTSNAARALADRLEEPALRETFLRIVSAVSGMHGSVSVSVSDVDFRAEAAGESLCRLVPYRELIHVHVGDAPAWECRVRDESGYYDVIDMIVRTLLRVSSR